MVCVSKSWPGTGGLDRAVEGFLTVKAHSGSLCSPARQVPLASTLQATWTPPQTELKILLRQWLNFTLKNFL